jgi:hypothetical protein
MTEAQMKTSEEQRARMKKELLDCQDALDAMQVEHDADVRQRDALVLQQKTVRKEKAESLESLNDVMAEHALAKSKYSAAEQRIKALEVQLKVETERKFTRTFLLFARFLHIHLYSPIHMHNTYACFRRSVAQDPG